MVATGHREFVTSRAIGVLEWTPDAVPEHAKVSGQNQLHQNFPELALIEGNPQVTMKPDESFSPSLFTFHWHLAAIYHH